MLGRDPQVFTDARRPKGADKSSGLYQYARVYQQAAAYQCSYEEANGPRLVMDRLAGRALSTSKHCLLVAAVHTRVLW